MNLKQIQKRIFLFLASFGLAIFWPTKMAFAQEESDWLDYFTNPLATFAKDYIGKAFFIGLDGILLIFNGILWVVVKITGYLVYVAGGFFDVMFNLMGVLNVGAVQTGWEICLDLANMFFILILLVIALATVLRFESYGMKALLPRLIIVALFINFSFVACGFIIDSANIVSDFFLQSEYLSGNISVKMMDGLNASNLMKAKDAGELSAGADAMVSVNILISYVMMLVVELVTFLVFTAGALMMLVRVIALWFLVIIAPLAWLSSVLPATKKIFSSWWNSFLKWTFFAPIYVFFMYLTIMITSEGDLMGSISNKPILSIEASEYSFTSVFAQTPEMIMQYILIIGMAIGSLVVAQKSGVHGSKYAMNIAKWGGRSASSGLNRWIAGGARMPGGQLLGKIARSRGGRKIGLDRVAEKVSGSAVGRATGKAFEYKRKGISTLSPTNIKRAYASSIARAESRTFKEGGGAGRLERLIEFSKNPFDKSKRNTYAARRQREKDIGDIQEDYSKRFKNGEQRQGAFITADNEIQREAALRELVKEDDISGAFNNPEFVNTINKYIKDPSQKVDVSKGLNADNMKKTLIGVFGQEEGARVGADIRSMARKNGNYSMPPTRWNENKGREEFIDKTKPEEKEKYFGKVKSKVLQKNAEKFMETVRKETFFGKDGLHDEGKQILSTLSAPHAKKVDELSNDVLEELNKNYDEISRYNKQIADAVRNHYQGGSTIETGSKYGSVK